MDKTYFCKDCMEKFNDKLAQDKHNWLKHPSNSYEKRWSELYKSGKIFTERYSMAYQDDPFH